VLQDGFDLFKCLILSGGIPFVSPLKWSKELVKIQALLWSHYGKSRDYFLQLQRAGGPLKYRKRLFLHQRQGFHLSRKYLSFIMGYKESESFDKL
jgi:hypothetical protein